MKNENIRQSKIEKLSSYTYTLNYINTLQEDIVEINERLYNPGHSALSPTKTSGFTVVSADDLIDKKDRKIRKLMEKKEQAEQLLDEIEEAIFNVDDVRLRDVLSKRFILGKSIVNISEEEKYTVRHMYRILDEALDVVRI